MHKLGAEERSPEYDVERAATGEACGSDAQTNAASTGSSAVAGKLPAILEGAPVLLKRVATWALMKVLHGVKFFLPDYACLLLSHRRRIGRFQNLERPKTFNEMILWRCLHPDPQWAELTRIATLLAEDLGYVRVDLYAPDDHFYFGELTFTRDDEPNPKSAKKTYPSDENPLESKFVSMMRCSG
jgi:hypothetical protein